MPTPRFRTFTTVMERRVSEHCLLTLYLIEHGLILLDHRGSILDSVLFRVGILAGLRSKRLDGRIVGVMVTASHNAEQVAPLVSVFLLLLISVPGQWR
jgi:hypothetical protein